MIMKLKVQHSLLVALSFTVTIFCSLAKLWATEVHGGQVSLLSSSDVSDSNRALLQEQVQQVVQQQAEELRQCFVMRPASPALRRRVTLLFGITTSGQTEAPAIAASELHDGPTEQCLIKVALGWTFPKPIHSNSVALCPLIVDPGINGSLPAQSPKTVPRESVQTYPSAGVRGTLDKELIRRIIRRHLDEVRACYESELKHAANLMGA